MSVWLSILHSSGRAYNNSTRNSAHVVRDIRQSYSISDVSDAMKVAQPIIESNGSIQCNLIALPASPPAD